LVRLNNHIAQERDELRIDMGRKSFGFGVGVGKHTFQNLAGMAMSFL
jgi:hypothetical protein